MLSSWRGVWAGAWGGECVCDGEGALELELGLERGSAVGSASDVGAGGGRVLAGRRVLAGGCRQVTALHLVLQVGWIHGSTALLRDLLQAAAGLLQRGGAGGGGRRAVEQAGRPGSLKRRLVQPQAVAGASQADPLPAKLSGYPRLPAAAPRWAPASRSAAQHAAE